MSGDKQFAPSPSAEERRADPRYPCAATHLSRVIVERQHESRWAWVRDISAGGLGLQFPGPVETGAVVLVRLAARAAPAAALRAEVVHAAPQPDGSWRVGCRFDNVRGDLSAGERAQLCDLFRTQAGDRAELPGLLAQRLATPLARPDGCGRPAEGRGAAAALEALLRTRAPQPCPTDKDRPQRP